MDRRRYPPGARLLVTPKAAGEPLFPPLNRLSGAAGPLLLGLLLCIFPSRDALPEEGGPNLEIQTSPATPVLRSPWTLSILVDHPRPAEVNVRPPDYPEALSLEQIRIGLRVVRDKEGERRLTAADFVFMPRTAGAVTLAPFEVLTPEGRTLTAEINLHIAGPPPVSRPRLRWISPPAPLTIGEEAELYLIQEDGGASPGPLSPEYRIQPPENAILETLPPGSRDGETGIILRLRIIPIGGKELVLPPVQVSREGNTLGIPPLILSLRPAPARETAAEAAVSHENSPDPDPPPAPPFPDKLTVSSFGEKVFPLFRREYIQIAERAGDLWEEGLRAEALAEIRRNERESAARTGLRFLRREMETALGIGTGEDEPWQPRKLLFMILPGNLILLCLLAGSRIFRFPHPRKKKNAIARFGSRFYNLVMILLLAVLGLTIPVLAADALDRGKEEGKAAIVRDTAVYRIPDTGGTAEARLEEGRRVLIRTTAGGWAHVESPEGINGWVYRETLIIY